MPIVDRIGHPVIISLIPLHKEVTAMSSKKCFLKVSVCVLALLLIVSLSAFGRPKPPSEIEEGAEEAMPMGKYREAPMLAEMVANGEIPPLEDRLPPEPMIAQTYSIGKYGGILRLFARVGKMYNEEFSAFPQFTRRSWERDGTYIMEMLENVELSDDFLTLTMYIRPGMKWSDGEPVTADDFLFSYNDLQLHPDVQIWGINPDTAEPVEQLDEWTIRINYKTPQPKILDSLATMANVSTPQAKHYLQKWHIDYNPDADKVAQEEGFDNWHEAMNSHLGGMAGGPYTDMDRPTLWPWTFTRMDPTVRAFVRNPYYPKVDAEGNQLPYIDEIVTQVVDPEVVNLKIISGEVDLEWHVTSFPNYTLYKENEAANDYTVYEMEGPNSGNLDLWLKGITHADPAKRALYQKENFRRALSIAINRDEINDIIFLGKGTPRQATVHPSEPYYKPEWGERDSEYDPERADRLLDEIGITKRDSEGFRLDLEGNPFVIVIEYPTTQAHIAEALELIKEYWEDVGIKVLIKGVAIQLFWEHGDQLEIEVAIGEGLGSYNLWRFARPWQRYLGAEAQIESGQRTIDDFADGKLPGEEPPQWARDYYNWFMDTRMVPNYSREYNELATKMLDYASENCLFIGTVGMVPHIVVAKNYVKNVPDRFPPTYAWPGALGEYMDQLYIDK
jgi:peptide/nickel transport system substrate-binding protein